MEPRLAMMHGILAALRVMAMVATCLLVPLAGAVAQEFTAGDLTIDHPFARATPGGAKTGAAYATIVNRGAASDRLVGASSPAATKVELHASSMEAGIMKMRALEAIEVKPGASLALSPGGALHFMLVGLKAPLKAGARFPMTLTFEKAGAVQVEVEIEAIGAGTGMGHSHTGSGG